MKKLSILAAMFGFIGAASAADITLYYSPSCPHCHHAREFISSTLVHEYPDLNVTAVNVMNQENLEMFQNVLQKCQYDNGGVPVLVIGEKCFQGYADFMQQELRDAVEADMSDKAKENAAENKQALADNADEFRAENQERANAVVEYDASAPVDAKKNDGASSIYFYGLLILLVAALGVVLIRKDKKK